MAVMAASAAIIVIFTIMLVVIFSCGEVMRRRGDIKIGFVDQYMSGPSAILIPYNFWMSNASKGGDPPYPKMEDHFPNHHVLKDAWETIRGEALDVYKGGYASDIKEDEFFRRVTDEKYNIYHIKWYGDILPDARALCPKTCALIDSLPDVHLAMFTILEPGGVITPHTGPFMGCLRYHLGLQSPADGGATILVDGKPYTWANGEDVLFDDTYVHEVKNVSDEARVILFCDVERKLHTDRAQDINHWVCKKFGPFSNKVNKKLEQKARTNGSNKRLEQTAKSSTADSKESLD